VCVDAWFIHYFECCFFCFFVTLDTLTAFKNINNSKDEQQRASTLHLNQQNNDDDNNNNDDEDNSHKVVATDDQDKEEENDVHNESKVAAKHVTTNNHKATASALSNKHTTAKKVDSKVESKRVDEEEFDPIEALNDAIFGEDDSNKSDETN
jgi:hypothetical protein